MLTLEEKIQELEIQLEKVSESKTIFNTINNEYGIELTAYQVRQNCYIEITYR